LLLRWHGGEREVWHEVRVPTVEQEDERRLHRERERLKKEQTSASNRIGSLLVTQGIQLPLNKHFVQALQAVRCWDGTPLPAQLHAELVRQWERHELAGRHLAALHAQQRQRLGHAAADDVMAQQMKQLMRLCSVGVQSAWTLSGEVFAWREIKNRRQLGALAGFTPTPYASGDSQREQGISKAGIAGVRTAMIELSWLWLRYQSDSALSRWYERRFGATGSKRSRRIGIVALARRLLVALWRYVHAGVIPEGAVLKAA
jgi:transposase